MNELLLIVGMMLVTLLARYPLLVIVGRVQLPQRIFRALRYVPVAVLVAIIVPAMLMPDGENLALHPSNAHLVGGIVAALVGWRFKNLLLTIVVGMVIFLLWRAIF